MRALVTTAIGHVVVDLDEECLLDEEGPEPAASDDPVGRGLPRLVAAAREGSRAVAVVDRRPPLLVSHDAGLTWSEAGAGLPPGRDVDIAPDDPDLVLFAGEERLFVSEDGGRFWRALAVELPDITAVAFHPDDRRDV